MKKNEGGLYADSRSLGCNVKFVKSLGGNTCNTHDTVDVFLKKKNMPYTILYSVFLQITICVQYK